VIAIDSACEMVRAELGNDVNLVEDHEITINGSGHSRLILPEPPVRAVSEVVINAGLSNEEILATTDYVLDDLPRLRGAYLRRIGTGATPMLINNYYGDTYPSWPRGLRNITITYDHGWDVVEPLSDPPPGFERVPAAIRSVALGLAKRIYVSNTSGATGATTSLRLGSATETFDVASAVAATSPLLTEDDVKALRPFKVLVFV
jgi:hypothetical protein